ncbi:anti sigma factor C-terminal domain-containing protein [Bacillus sp. FJAT-49711]|uniref:anti sigma factor C-terminal domain-containing protein n=1 Tax=Bacillus sp. FJAT-49711 TaxID=2833585 RepID=UPI001BC9E956|nr:anti sigma factor C-terminal domain-containing protein [Bacillus sp. FJAT-49711]MBS4219955.1 anti sigma factor C-terminal domain-containing protein [Bacillus sp. FJAT-49711]
MKDRSIFEKDDSFSDLVKKARRKSIKRSILISILVTISTLILLWAMLYIGQYFMYERMYKDVEEKNDYYQMYGANIYPGGATYDHFFVAGKSNASTYKEVNGHLINWNTMSDFHTILGMKASLNTSSYIGVNDRSYNNNYKVVKFHLPKIEAFHNDLDYLESLPGFYSVEVALSFQEELTLSEVNQTFPTASWIWLLQDRLNEEAAESQASSAFQKDFSEIDGDHALGFPVEPSKPFKAGAEQYIHFLQGKLDELVDTKEALEVLKQENPNQIPVAGVILTGTVDQVLPYTKQSSVRIVRTGVIIPY